MRNRFEPAFTRVMDRMDTMPFIVLRTVAYVTALTHTGTTGYVIAGSVFLLEGIATMRYRRIRRRREKERDDRDSSLHWA